MKYIVIAEDDPDLAQTLSDVIADRLYVATHIVANGALVPDAITLRRPDLLILDLALPGLYGLDVFDLVRSDERWRGVPVLFLTGSPEKAAAVVSNGNGEHRVLSKPFDIDVLVNEVDELVDGSRTPAAA